jgi:hypothetical protein
LEAEKGLAEVTMDDEADLRTLGIRGRRRKALDRDEWRAVLEEGKARRGL